MKRMYIVHTRNKKSKQLMNRTFSAEDSDLLPDIFLFDLVLYKQFLELFSFFKLGIALSELSSLTVEIEVTVFICGEINFLFKKINQ